MFDVPQACIWFADLCSLRSQDQTHILARFARATALQKIRLASLADLLSLVAWGLTNVKHVKHSVELD
jgi:hypothetical protein